MVKKEILLLAAITFAACFPLRGGQQTGLRNTPYRMVFQGQISLPLLSDSPDIPSDIVFDGEAEEPMLYVLNSYKRRIEVFNLKDQSFKILELNPKPDHPINGFGVREGKVYLYDYWMHTVHEYRDGRHVNQYDIRQDEFVHGRRTPYVYVQTLSPIKLFGNTLVMTGFRAGEVSRSPDIQDLVLTLLDLGSGKIANAVVMPEVYGKYNWGGGFAYRMPYFDLGYDGEVVCCFAASEELSAYSLRTARMRQVRAPSRYISKIEPYSKSDRKTPAGGAEMQWYRNNPSYDGILYDKWREVYYRIALQPERPDRRGTKDMYRKPISIIVLDKNLQPLGETLLEEDVFFRPYCCFVSPEGLFIQVLKGDEDHLYFYQYQHVEK